MWTRNIYFNIHECESQGDVLVFLTGEEEIEDVCQKIRFESEKLDKNTNTNKSNNKKSSFFIVLKGFILILYDVKIQKVS